MQVADKTVVIAGLGVSGTSLAEVLRERGTHVIGVDERKPEADLHSFDDVDWDHVDYVMSSPVFNPRTPFVLEAQRRGIPVMSEVEFAWQLRVNNERTGARILHTHRHAARDEGQAGSACVPVAQARHSLRARADHLRLARRHCDLPSDAAGGDKEQGVNTTSLNDRVAGSPHRRRAKGGQVRPRSRFASGGRGQRPGSRSIRPPSTAIASTSPPRTPLTGQRRSPCERGAMDTRQAATPAAVPTGSSATATRILRAQGKEHAWHHSRHRTNTTTGKRGAACSSGP